VCSRIVERQFIRLAFGQCLAADVPNHLSGSSDVDPRCKYFNYTLVTVVPLSRYNVLIYDLFF
jgi:hypothetical protein